MMIYEDTVYKHTLDKVEAILTYFEPYANF